MISVLCISERSNYRRYNDLDLWDEKRNAYNFTGTNPIITHAPCAQWSRLKGVAHKNDYIKKLAPWCFDRVLENGGIFEHPLESSIWKYMGKKPTVNVQMNWFDMPVKKKTGLYFSKCEPDLVPISFNAITHAVGYSQNFKEWPKHRRSETPTKMIDWFLRSIQNSGLRQE